MSTIFNKGWIRLDTAALIFPATMNSKWSNVFRLSATLKEDIDPDIYEEFNMDRVGVVNTSCDKDPLSIIITRQLFPSYDKSRIRVAGIEFHKDEQIKHAIFESIFCNVTIYTLVAVM